MKNKKTNKSGKIRNIRKTRKSRMTKKGGSKIFTTEGKMINIDELYEGKHFFKKMTTNENEKKICKILMENPHKNIVKIYEIGEDYILMEMLKTKLYDVDVKQIKEKMMEAKHYLQGLGIMYVDWKFDNIGISEEDGEIKLFDFDVSGLIKPCEWEIQPYGYSYKQAIANGQKTPIAIDNYAFEAEIREF